MYNNPSSTYTHIHTHTHTHLNTHNIRSHRDTVHIGTHTHTTHLTIVLFGTFYVQVWEAAVAAAIFAAGELGAD